MVKKKKKTPVKKKTQKTQSRKDLTGSLLVAEAASRITDQDSCAYSVLIFNEGNPPEDWRKMGVEALSKFAEFGFCIFHAFGGTSLDWDKSIENVIKKIKKLPERKK